jgi:hypothetical protein
VKINALPFPSKTKFLDKFFTALEEDVKLRDAYYQRFDPDYVSYSPEDSREDILLALSFYGGYRTRRRLIEAVPIIPDGIVLNIGPEMGTESFMLAELYNRVLVAEPDARTAEILSELTRHYKTEDGRNASDIIRVEQAGVVPVGAFILSNCDGVPHGPVHYDASGARDVHDVFGDHFAHRIFLNHLALMMPQEPKLEVLLQSLAAYCRNDGSITWCDSVSELSEIVTEDAGNRRRAVYDEKRCSLKVIKKSIMELLPDFHVSFRINRKPHQLVTIARHK